MAGSFAGRQDHAFRRAGGRAPHAVDLLAIGIGTADHTLEQPVAHGAGTAGRLGQILKPEEDALGRAAAHIGGGDADLRMVRHQAARSCSRKSCAKRCSTPARLIDRDLFGGVEAAFDGHHLFGSIDAADDQRKLGARRGRSRDIIGLGPVQLQAKTGHAIDELQRAARPCRSDWCGGCVRNLRRQWLRHPQGARPWRPSRATIPGRNRPPAMMISGWRRVR